MTGATIRDRRRLERRLRRLHWTLRALYLGILVAAAVEIVK